MQGDIYGGDAGQIVQVSSYSPPVNTAVEGEKLFNGENVMAAWKHELAGGSDILLRAYWDRTDRQELNYREVRNTFDFDFIHHKPFERHDVTWGLGARISPSTYYQLVPTVNFSPAEQTYNIFSAFLQDEISLVPDRLTLTLGSKFEHTTFSGFDYQPSGRLSWTPSDKHTIWAAVTRAVRTASRIEEGFNLSFLTAPSVPLYLRLIGDGDFTPEQLIGYELGYRNYISKHAIFTGALFHNRYDDLLSVESAPTFAETSPAPLHLVLPLYLRNGIAANSNGGEVIGLWDATAWLRLRGSYSLVLIDAIRRPGSDDASTVKQLEGDSPAHKIVIQSLFQLPRRVDINLTYRYVSAIRNQAVPAYSTGDARIGWRPKGPCEFEVVGANLLQPSHVEYGGLPGPLVAIKRSVYAGIVWRL